MTVLTAKTRAKIPTKSFALPGRRFPVHDKMHARVAKSYASRMVKRGQLTPEQKNRVFAAANRRLAMQLGGITPIKATPEMKRKFFPWGKGLPGGAIRPNPFDPQPFRQGGSVMAGRRCAACGGKMMADGGRMKCMKCGGRAKMQVGGTTLGNSGRTRRMRMRMRYATGGAVNPVGYEGMRGQVRLRGNPNHPGGFARFDGDGEGG